MVRSTSDALHDGWHQDLVPGPARLSEGVTAIPIPMPTGPFPFSLAYLLDAADGPHLVDPGWCDARALSALRAGVEGVGHALEDIRTVTVTHAHPDHLGLASRLRAGGARIVMGAVETADLVASARPVSEASSARLLERWAVPDHRRPELLAVVLAPTRPSPAPPVVDDRLRDGEPVPWPGWTATAVVTPGHTRGHLCLHLPDRDAVLTGDHVLPTINPGIGLGGRAADPVRDVLTSLDRVAALDTGRTVVLPGHAYPFRGLAGRCAEIAAHHRRRSAEVAAVLSSDPRSTVWQIASQLTWTAGWARMRDGFLWSALAQTQMHVDHVRRG